MKKSDLMFIVAALVVAGVALWMLNSTNAGNTSEIIMLAVITILVGIAIFRAVAGIKSSIRHEVVEDELSKKIMTKASSLAYYISFYLWLFLMYYSDKTKPEAYSLIGAGISGMAIIFFLSWLFVKFKGIKNE
jgi:peptidoglycan/LPS O-acetylase OafA/YrhL